MTIKEREKEGEKQKEKNEREIGGRNTERMREKVKMASEKEDRVTGKTKIC